MGAHGHGGPDPTPAVHDAVMPPHAVTQTPSHALVKVPVAQEPVFQAGEGCVHGALQFHLFAMAVDNLGFRV